MSKMNKTKPKSLQRSNSLGSLHGSSSEQEGYIFFDPMVLSQAMPARSNKIWCIEPNKTTLWNNGSSKFQRKFSQNIPQSKKETSSERNLPSKTDEDKAQKLSGGSNEEDEQLTSSKEEISPSANAVETLQSAAPFQDDTINEVSSKSGPILDISICNYDQIKGSSLQKIIQLQEIKLEREKKTIISLQEKLGSCQEINLKLKSEILSLEKSMNEREYVIERMKTVIDDLSRQRDDMMSEMSVSKLYIEEKVTYLVSEIKQLERREQITRELLKEVCGEDKQSFEKSTIIVNQNTKLVEQMENMKEHFNLKESVIKSLEKQLTGVANENNVERGTKGLEDALKKAEKDRDGIFEDYQNSLNEWESIRCDMEKQNEKIYDNLNNVQIEKDSLESELCDVRKELDEKCACLEEYQVLLTKRENELHETRKTLNKTKLETQRSLNELQDEIQVVRKQNDEAYDLLEIATSDLKFVQKRNNELEECCSAKELQREQSVRVLNELKLSDEDLKMAKTQLENKYSEVLLDMNTLTERCDKVTRINVELEDNLLSMSEKNEAVIIDNDRLHEELEVASKELKKLSGKTEEFDKEKSELSEMVATLREVKSCLCVEVDELKVSLQLSQHDLQAGNITEDVDSLKSEIKNLSEELQEKDSKFITYKQSTEARGQKKENEMSNEYKFLSLELAKIITELEDCKEESLKDSQCYEQKVHLMEEEKSKLLVGLNVCKQLEIGLNNMIQDLQGDILQQQQRFKEESQAILQETDDAKKRISSIAEHCKKQLVAKNADIYNLQDRNQKLCEQIYEFEEAIRKFQKREEMTSKQNGHLKRQKKSLKLKLLKSLTVEKRMEKRHQREKNRMKSLLGDVNERDARLTATAEVEDNLNTIIQDMNVELAKVKIENVVQRDEINIQITNLQIGDENLKEMKKFVRSCKKLSIEQTGKYNELVKEHSFEKDKQEILKDEIDAYERKIDDLHEQLHQADRRYSDMKRRQESGDKCCNELKEKLNSLHTKIESLTFELSDKKSLYDQTKLQLSVLRTQYDISQKELEDKELDCNRKHSLSFEMKNCVVKQNDDLVMELRKSHSSVLAAIHEKQMGEMRNELEEMKRKGALRREIAMSALGSKSCTTIMCP